MPPAPSRRRLLVGGAALTSVGALETLGAGSTAAATVRPYSSTSVPSAKARHYMNRLGCGYSRTTWTQLQKAGDVKRWLDAQLAPTSIAESSTAKALPGWFPDMDQSAQTKWGRNSSGSKGSWEFAEDLASYTMLRRIYSSRQVFENMVDFWSNHLHVHADGDLAWVHRASYDQLIRKHALGRFDDMLVAAALHPAMLLYLDNWRSVRNAPNENQGRELLELHTVGRASGYTEQMVKDSAKILSGYTVDAFDSWDGFYDSGKHTTGPVQVLGFTAANSSANGQQLTVDYLRYLAQHPATALNIARKLARKFVSDDPTTDLVNTVAQVFRDSGTDIKATLRALVAHPDFYASRDRLVRNPVEDFVATCRVLRIAAKAPTSDDSFARSCLWLPETTLLYQWPRPDGSPYGATAWASATRMLSSFRMHWDLTAGWWPTKDVTYRKPASWLPQERIRFDQYVDHLSRMLLGRPSTSKILDVAMAATGCGASTVITKNHAVSSWLFVRLVGALLDSPEHMRH
jgi:uncharacterized protein (DUF1800 family)